MRVLLTGATGYLGSHTAVELMASGHDVVGVDDFSESSPKTQQAIECIAGRPLHLIEQDLRDVKRVGDLVESGNFDAIVHFAGRKFVAESVANPLRYYDRNLTTAIAIAKAARDSGVARIIFSSSCTVYGNPTRVPVDERAPVRPVSPYGRTKAYIEQMLADCCDADPDLNVTALRYFNPIGAHPSGGLGEIPVGRPNNLVPFVMEVVRQERSHLSVFGGDYDTPDGTCIRDYIHVVDLAMAHVRALETIDAKRGFSAINLGTGIGSSVLDVVAACERATGRDIPYRIEERRHGDAAVVFADPAKAHAELGWKAGADLDQMCQDHWRFAEQHPTMGTVR